MSYLDTVARLKKIKKAPGGSPTKPAKPGFDGFERSGGSPPEIFTAHDWQVTFPDDRTVRTWNGPATPAEVVTERSGAVSAAPYQAPPAEVPDTPLTKAEEAAIRRWLDSIGETDPDIIAETLDSCRQDQVARKYFLRWAAEIKTLSPQQQAALDQLQETPSLWFAFMVNDPDTDSVRVSVAMRRPEYNVVGDLLIPAEKWDPWLFLETLSRQKEAN